MNVKGIKDAVWSVTEKTCAFRKPAPRSLQLLEEYSLKHDRLKKLVLERLEDEFRRRRLTLIAHAGVDTREPAITIRPLYGNSGRELLLKGSPDIIAVFCNGKNMVIVIVEVKSTVYSALESPGIYQALVYSYVAYAASFPNSIDSHGNAVAHERLTFEARGDSIDIDLSVKAEMRLIAHDYIGLACYSPEKMYYGLIAYKDYNTIEFMPVFKALGGRVEVADWYGTTLLDILYPIIQESIAPSGSIDYTPGPWCDSCAILDSCPVYTHGRGGVR